MSRSAAITANAFPSRRLRRRSSASACSLHASHTRWKPPSPFTARIFPARSNSTARANMAFDSSRVFPQVTSLDGEPEGAACGDTPTGLPEWATLPQPMEEA